MTILEYKKGLKRQKWIFLLFWLHFIIIGFSFVTNRAYRAALWAAAATGLLNTMLTLKYYQRHSKLWRFQNMTVMWRHHDVISSQDFPLEVLVIVDFGYFWDPCLEKFWKFSKSERNVTSLWRHRFSRFSVGSGFSSIFGCFWNFRHLFL